MRTAIWAIWGCLTVLVPTLFAQDSADSLQSKLLPDTIKAVPTITYVIPAGPEAGSFTQASRLQVVDTVAGWAKILVEGWVPVEKILPRMTSSAPVIFEQTKSTPKKPKVKQERPQCDAVTLKGERCSRKAMSGSKKCWQHGH